MGRKKLDEKYLLKHELKTRVTESKFRELESILKKTQNKDMSSLLRSILYNRPIKTVSHDNSLDLVMEELSKLRSQIRAIGVNVNQITRFFNTYGESRKKEFYAKIAFGEYKNIETKIDKLLTLVSMLSKKWLSK